MHQGVTNVPGIEVGHYTDLTQATGCTVALCRAGAVGGVDVRGGAPGTRETDLLRPGNQVQQVHAVLLTGGSAFGLAAADGVMGYLEGHGVGFKMGANIIPIVSAAVLFDLNLVGGQSRPGPAEGLKACEAASSGRVTEGSVGAGTGATVAKALGIAHALKSGLGTACIQLGDGLAVGALVAVNAFGGIVDHSTGEVVAGPRGQEPPLIMDTMELLIDNEPQLDAHPGENTTIGLVATNAPLTKEQANFLARISHDGLAMTVRPCHTLRDGDTMFAMATGTSNASPDLTRLGAAAVEATAQAVLRAIRHASSLGGIPSALEWTGG